VNEKPKQRLNRDQRRAREAAEMAVFIAAYGRQAQKGVEPNDRPYSTAFARRVRRMSPSEFYRRLREDEE
jgi:hypothetical protein